MIGTVDADASGFPVGSPSSPAMANNDTVGVSASQLDLGPLQNNGGPTPTDGLIAGSVAVGAGNTALVTNPPFTTPATDQRGTGRRCARSITMWTSAPSSCKRRPLRTSARTRPPRGSPSP